MPQSMHPAALFAVGERAPFEAHPVACGRQHGRAVNCLRAPRERRLYIAYHIFAVEYKPEEKAENPYEKRERNGVPQYWSIRLARGVAEEYVWREEVDYGQEEREAFVGVHHPAGVGIVQYLEEVALRVIAHNAEAPEHEVVERD